MEKRYPIIGLYILMFVVVTVIIATGILANGRDMGVNATTEESVESNYLIDTVVEIDNVVTDDDKLVINYFDMYKWIVYYNESSTVENMTYIYEFSSEKEAQEMVSIRKQELMLNGTISVQDCRAVENYVVVDLVDTSFKNVSRNILEKNFSGLIVF